MTHEHKGGTPASPDIDMGVPEVCDKCDRDCPEPCEAFKRLVSVTNYLNGLENTGSFIDKQKILNYLEGRK